MNDPNPGYEHTDGSPHVVLMVGAGLAVGLVVAWLAARGFYRHDAHVYGEDAEAGRQTSFHESPELRLPILANRYEMNRAAHERLESYTWADAAHSAVHIPIGRAMELLGGAPPPRDRPYPVSDTMTPAPPPVPPAPSSPR